MRLSFWPALAGALAGLALAVAAQLCLRCPNRWEKVCSTWLTHGEGGDGYGAE